MPFPDVNIVVDIHSEPMTRRVLTDGTIIGLDPGLEKPYRQSIADAVASLETKGVPTVWVRFVPPPEIVRQQTAAQKAEALLMDEAMGIKPDSIIIYKNSFGAFGDGQTSDGRSLHAVLQKMEATRLSLMGGNADVCVLATAVGGIQHGYGVTILSDLLVGRNNSSKDIFTDEHQIYVTLENIRQNPTALKAHNHPLKSDYTSPLSIREQEMIRGHLRIAHFSDLLYELDNNLSASLPPATRPNDARPIARLTKVVAPSLSVIYISPSVDEGSSCPTRLKTPFQQCRGFIK